MNKTLKRALYLGLSIAMIGGLNAGLTSQARAASKQSSVIMPRHVRLNRRRISMKNLKSHRRNIKRGRKFTKLASRQNHRGRRIIRQRHGKTALRRMHRRAGNLKAVHLTAKQTHHQSKFIQLLQNSRYAKTGLNDLVKYYRSGHRNADHSYADETFGAVRLHGRNYLITFNSNKRSKDYGAEYLYRFNPRLTFQSNKNFNRRNNVPQRNQGFAYRYYRFGRKGYCVNFNRGTVKSGRRFVKPIAKILTK